MNLRRGSVVLALFLLAGSILTAPTAGAHPAADWYTHTWSPAVRDEIQMIWASPGLVGGSGTTAYNRRERIKDGFAVWNAQPPNVLFQFGVTDTTLTQNITHCPLDDNQNGIFWVNLTDPPQRNIRGDAQRCRYDDGTISYYRVRFDGPDNWYLGTGDVPVNQYDLWGVATHESGHATGFRPHWDEGANSDTTLCPGNTSNHTMCRWLVGRGKYIRTLEAHDAQTFDNAY